MLYFSVKLKWKMLGRGEQWYSSLENEVNVRLGSMFHLWEWLRLLEPLPIVENDDINVANFPWVNSCFSFQMPIMQDSLSFPIRKRGRPFKVTKKISAEDDEVTKVDTPGSPANTTIDAHCDSYPRKTLRQPRTPRLTDTVSSTRRSSRRKEQPVRYREESVSPAGRQASTPNRRLRGPKKLSYGRESSPESESPCRSPTPRRRTGTRGYKQRSTRQNESPASSREASPSPRKLTTKPNERSDKGERFSTPKKLFPKRQPSPEISSPSHRCPGASNRSATPSRNSRGLEGEQGLLTPSKRKILSPGMEWFYS